MCQIILRAAGLPLAWTEETARYLFVWVIYLAASKAVRYGKHMSVDLLPLILKGKGRTLLFAFAHVVCLLFFVILFYYGTCVLQGMSVKPQYSAAGGINMMIPYAAPTVGSALMIIRGVQILIGDLKDLFGRQTSTEVDE
jgi:TRAP-type C4-dicarboxylate transport system permease small subunit